MSRLSINTIKSLRIAYVVLTVVVSSISANSVKRFFLAPIWLYSSCYGRFKYDVITTWGRVTGS